MEADEHFRHKDVYQHSLTVLRQAIALEERYGLHSDLVVRLAALLHDIGKPRTRSMLPGGRVASTTTRSSGRRWPASGSLRCGSPACDR